MAFQSSDGVRRLHRRAWILAGGESVGRGQEDAPRYDVRCIQKIQV